ncbi:PHD and RING finger domain-containing protein 1 isoform X2 [Xyrichtys novacula]|uniref:PHD and RING finger domain-containing protein 1 isoform X2 n=1 Tax=Xyrichtys novacula TaxID=13765 RepID=A0AAV1F8Q1_XYRNO|nr:PHD and RING finger domain-containing protein 1 isoform X2 [Xyrichtys novacula]
MITVQKPVKVGQEETISVDFEQTNCEVCGGSDREDRLLLCDGCDAGYHMECLTPPLDSVPVEEWFCPECEAHNRHSRGSAEELSDTESLPSTAGPTTSHSLSRAVGPTRAIARTQQSERVRANVNRHRITQARSSQLAPTYLIQSTWLDETINAVVAGLNTSVYIRNLTPRIPSSRRRKTGKRRKAKKTSAKSRSGKAATTGVKRRRRRTRKGRARKKLALKKSATTRSRIANSLGIVKDKKSSSLPTVYRPAEHTLSNMRADIGAASLSIYGDPFDLDPFVDREEVDQHAHVTSLLEAKRRGISRSALRSHQPVARPVTGSLSRRAVGVPQSVGVAEAAPVPDLLGSILTGQSMLLMDSSDVVINRDGSLKAAKPAMACVSKPGCSKSSISGDASAHINSVMSPNQGDTSLPFHYDEDLPGSSHSSTSRPFSQSSSCVPPYMSPSASRIQPATHSDLPPRGHSSLLPVRPNRSTHPPGHQGTNGVVDLTHSPSIQPTQDSGSSKSNLSKKAPTKPMWVDVSVLPRIPKIRRESSDGTRNAISQGASIVNNRTSSKANRSNSTPTRHGHGVPDPGMNSLAGDKGRQQSIDQQKGRAGGPSQRQRPDGAGSSSAFSNSFSSSSSSTGFPSSQSHFSSSSSSASSSVSFRINSSGNSWHSRHLGMASSSAGGDGMQERWSKKEDEVRKRQLHRDKQMLLASHVQVKKEQDTNNIYDPFNPTLSDSDSEDESPQKTTHEAKAPSLGKMEDMVQIKPNQVHVKTEKQDIDVSHEEPRGSSASENISQQVRCSEVFVKIEETARSETETPREKLDIEIKKERELDDPEEEQRCGSSDVRVKPEPMETPPPVCQSRVHIKMETETLEESVGTSTSTLSNSSSTPSSAPPKKKQKTETKPDPKSPSRDSGSRKKTSRASKERRSSSSETDKGKKGDQAGRQREKEKKQERSSRRSRSREKRRARTTSESSQSNSPDRSHRKRQQSRSRSKDRWRSRSGSSSSSRERSRRKKNKQRSKERNDGRERDQEKRQVSKDKRHGRSHSKSMSKSPSRSRSKERKRRRSKSKSQSRSRSRSRERRKTDSRPQRSSLPSRDKAESQSKRRHRSRSSSRERKKDKGSSSKTSQKPSGSSVSSSHDTKPQDKKKERDAPQSSIKEERVVAVKKEEVPVSIAAPKVKMEDQGTDGHAKPEETVKETKTGKEIKKEKQPSLDMFEDSPILKPIKEEASESCALGEDKGGQEEGNQEDPVKTETHEIAVIKSEPSSPESSHFPTVTSFPSLPTPVTDDSLQNKVLQSQPVTSTEQTNTVSVKQEVQQPSDSDDDFNVDVMLDNLDYVKAEPKKESGSSVNKEKDAEEGKSETERGSTIAGVKSKTHVKRVTWNIQEPEGPQPEKSASKLALYKLRLKQEGLRRPSSAPQDITGTVSDPSKKVAGGPPSSSSRSDGIHPEGLPSTGQAEAEKGDMSSKDKQYLKKLHMQERAVEEVKLAIKPFYQKRDINKDEYKEILRKAVQKVCHSKSGEINPVKVGNLVKAYVDKYKHARKHKKGEDLGETKETQGKTMKTSDSP